jgi:O-antigen ligase
MIDVYLTPIFWCELPVIILIGLVCLWNKAEYGLFLYAFALGFPDVAFPLGTTINIRIDDVLILLFLARTILWVPAPLSGMQRKIFMWQAIFLGCCILSIAVETAQGTPPLGYDAARMAGCAVIFVVLPLLLQTERRIRFFVAGLMCAGVALAIQVFMHLGARPSNDFANFQQLKGTAAFATWNPNTIGNAAIVLVFAAGLGWISLSGTLAGKIFWHSMAVGFALVPVLVFIRGSSISIVASFVLFFCLLRRWGSLLAFAAMCLCVLLYLHSRDPELMKGATTVNVTTGEGFSERFDRWDMAVQGIQDRPWMGQGFGQELMYLTQIGSEGVAHNDCLTIWLELGLGGLLLFLATIFQFVRAGCHLYGKPPCQRQGALILAVTFALCLDSLGQPTLYWEKLPTIALSLAVAVAGICERNELETALEPIHTFAHQPSGQYT